MAFGVLEQDILQGWQQVPQLIQQNQHHAVLHVFCFTESLLYKYLTLVNCPIGAPESLLYRGPVLLSIDQGKAFFFIADMRKRTASDIQKRPEGEIKQILNMDTRLDLAM